MFGLVEIRFQIGSFLRTIKPEMEFKHVHSWQILYYLRLKYLFGIQGIRSQ